MIIHSYIQIAPSVMQMMNKHMKSSQNHSQVKDSSILLPFPASWTTTQACYVPYLQNQQGIPSEASHMKSIDK